ATSTRWAPWYVIPADRKWFARICAAAVIVHTLTEIDPRYPVLSKDRRQQLQAVKRELEAEAPKDAPADPFAAKEAGAKAKAAARAGRAAEGAAGAGAEARAAARTAAEAAAKAKAAARTAARAAAGDGQRPGGADDRSQPAPAGRARGGTSPLGRPAQAARR